MSNLTNDKLTGHIVLIFVLDHQTFPSTLVSFALLSPSELHLVSLKIGLFLDNFHKPHPIAQHIAPAVIEGEKNILFLLLKYPYHQQGSLV